MSGPEQNRPSRRSWNWKTALLTAAIVAVVFLAMLAVERAALDNPPDAKEDKAEKSGKPAAPESRSLVSVQPNLASPLDPGLAMAAPKEQQEAPDSQQNLDAIQARDEAANLAREGKYLEAIQKMDQAMRLEPDNDLYRRDMSHLNAAMGMKCFEDRQFERALGFFDEAIYYWNGNQEAYRGKGYVYLQTNRVKQAEEWLLKYIQVGGDRPDVYALLGRIYYGENRLEDAIYFYRISLSLDPEQPDLIKAVEKVRRESEIEADFETDSTRHFKIKYEGDKMPEVSRIVDVLCEEAYIEIGRNLGFYPANPVTVILYTDRDFQDVTRSPAWAGAIFDGKIRIPARGIRQRNSELERIVFHEYTHALVHEISRGRAPIWLHEGLAQSYEGTPADTKTLALMLVKGGGPIPLKNLEGSFLVLPRQQAQLAYQESRLAVVFLEDSYGPYVMKEILRELQNGQTPAGALKNVTGRDYGTIDSDFGDWVRDMAD